MIRSVVFGSVVLGMVASVAGCKVTVETKNRYTETNVVRTDTQDWTGQPIEIQIEGAGVIVNGGVNVEASTDPNVTKVAANARILAMAFAENEADAKLSLEDVKTGFQITHTDSLIKIFCPHGQTHGGSNSGESGCELTNIVVPQGTDASKISVKVLSGNGDVTLNFAAAKLASLTAGANGAACNITANVGSSVASKGAVISLNSQQAGDVTLRVPSDFAADKVFLVADAGKTTNSFADLTATDGTVGRGAAGTGFSEIKLTSVSFAGSTGQVSLTQ